MSESIAMEVAHRPLEHIVRFDQPVAEAYETAKKQALISRMVAVARKYVMDSKLYNAVLEVRDDAVMLKNAAFCGEAVICIIKDGKVVPYF